MASFIHVIIISIVVCLFVCGCVLVLILFGFFLVREVRIRRMASFEKRCYNSCVLCVCVTCLKEKIIFLKYTTTKFKDTKTSINKDKRKLKEK